MDSFQFQPTLTDLEDRLTPASPAELMNIMQQVSVDTQAIQRIAQFASEPRSIATLTQMSTELAGIARRSESYGNELGEFFGQLVSAVQANPAIQSAVLPYAMPVANKLISAQINNGIAQNTLAFTTNSITDQGGTVPLEAMVNPPAPPAPPMPPVETQPDGPVDANGIRITRPPLDAPQWMDLGNGLRIWNVVEGVGPVVAPGDNVVVNYRGWLRDTGAEFDSNLASGEPAPFSLNAVIDGFAQGIPGMQPGGVRRLDIPAELAYGERGIPGSIPPNTGLVFEVQLISSSTPDNTGTTGVPFFPTSGNNGANTVPTNGSTGIFPGTSSGTTTFPSGGNAGTGTVPNNGNTPGITPVGGTPNGTFPSNGTTGGTTTSGTGTTGFGGTTTSGTGTTGGGINNGNVFPQ